MENYQPTDDMKTMSNSELYQYQVQKIKQQDDQIDPILLRKLQRMRIQPRRLRMLIIIHLYLIQWMKN